MLSKDRIQKDTDNVLIHNNLALALTQSGDYVLVLGGGIPDLALVKKEMAIGNFRILGYGRSIEVLVDSTESLDGVFSINPDIVVLEIQAQGEWTLNVLPR